MLIKDPWKRSQAKLEIKKMMLFDKIWMKLSQAISVIEEELPRIYSNREKIPENAIKIFVYETRNEYYDFTQAMKYVEDFDWIRNLPWPEWFVNDPEITEEQLEDEILGLQEYEVDPLENYGSFIDKLRGSVRAHTKSFIE